jgi:valyl-tRNA synthetase
MELGKNFAHSASEQKWYQHWEQSGYFTSVPDERPPYTIVIPPPNVTGVLHMGHALNNTVQDILLRRAKMQGYNTCWVPGTDHASIATEAKVVGMLREKGIDKKNISRDEFMKYAWERQIWRYHSATVAQDGFLLRLEPYCLHHGGQLLRSSNTCIC